MPKRKSFFRLRRRKLNSKGTIMSQAKVDKRKQEKLHRKEIMRKQKIKHYTALCLTAIIGVGIVGYIGYSAYDAVKGTNTSSTSAESVEVNMSAISDYTNSLSND